MQYVCVVLSGKNIACAHARLVLVARAEARAALGTRLGRIYIARNGASDT